LLAVVDADHLEMPVFDREQRRVDLPRTDQEDSLGEALHLADLLDPIPLLFRAVDSWQFCTREAIELLPTATADCRLVLSF